MMGEDVARIGPMLVLAGMAVGWMSAAVRPAGGQELLADMSIALVGSAIVGGVVFGSVSTGLGMVTMFGFGCAGAALTIIAQRMVWPSIRPKD